jgi:hypothetical protein
MMSDETSSTNTDKTTICANVNNLKTLEGIKYIIVRGMTRAPTRMNVHDVCTNINANTSLGIAKFVIKHGIWHHHIQLDVEEYVNTERRQRVNISQILPAFLNLECLCSITSVARVDDTLNVVAI